MPRPESHRLLPQDPHTPPPAGTVVGIGSLPHSDFARAFQFIEEQKLNFPFLPQLPKAPGHGNMLDELANRENGVFASDELPRFLKQQRQQLEIVSKEGHIESHLPREICLKWQLVGPLTYRKFSGQTLAECGDLLLNEIQTRLSILLRTLEDTSCKQILFLDEPVLDSEECREGLRSEEYRAFVTSLRSVFARANIDLVLGLHCCGRFDASSSEILFRLGFQIISFDLHLFTSADELSLFLLSLNRELVWCLGSVPCVAPGMAPAVETKELFGDHQTTKAMALIEKLKVNLTQVTNQHPELRDSLRRSLISASCGLSGLSEKDAAFSFAQQKDFAKWLKQVCGATALA